MVNKIGLIDIFSRLSFKTKKELVDKVREVYPVLIRSTNKLLVCGDGAGERINLAFKKEKESYVIVDYYVEDNLFKINDDELKGFENDLKGMSEKYLFKNVILYNELIEGDKIQDIEDEILVTKRELIINEIVSRRKD